MSVRKFRFDHFFLDERDHLLTRGGQTISLTPKAFDTLLYLLENPQRLVTREELIRSIWPNSFVEDGSLSVNISVLRRALGSMEDGESFIETVPRKGYRFRAEVSIVEEDFEGAVAWVQGGGRTTAQVSSIELRAVREGHVGPVLIRKDSLANSGRDGIAVSEGPAPSSRLTSMALIGLLIGISSVSLLLFLSRNYHFESPSTAPFAVMSISRVTPNGEIADAALSPDAKSVAYVRRETVGQSLWVRRLDTTQDRRVLLAETGDHLSVAFSNDGSGCLYYVRSMQSAETALYRLPAHSTEPQRVIDGVSGTFSLAPDGKHFAFVRMEPARWEAELLAGSLDGSGLRRIASRARPAYFSLSRPAWSGDGQFLMCFAGKAADYGTKAFRAVRIRLTDGQETTLSHHSWARVGPIVRSPSGYLLFTASERRSDPLQVWALSMKDGRVSRVTNDLANYSSLSFSADGKTLAAMQTDTAVDLSIAPRQNPDWAKPASPAMIQGFRGLAWTPDGRLIYSASTADSANLFEIQNDGNPKQLTVGQNDALEPAVTRDGRYVLYQAAAKIWRINRDGSQAVQLTLGAHDVHPAPAADGQSVVYSSFANWTPGIGGKPTLWSVPINGGEPHQLTGLATSVPKISPDGSLIAAEYFPGGDPRFSPCQIAVFEAKNGRLLKVFAPPSLSEGAIAWAPDGKAIDFTSLDKGVGNIWRQPLDGSTPYPVSHNPIGELFDLAWSFDGQQLAVGRGRKTSDVVLLRDLSFER